MKDLTLFPSCNAERGAAVDQKTNCFAITLCMASRGDRGKAGQCQTVKGKRFCTSAAMVCAFADKGDERKPCR